MIEIDVFSQNELKAFRDFNMFLTRITKFN